METHVPFFEVLVFRINRMKIHTVTLAFHIALATCIVSVPAAHGGESEAKQQGAKLDTQVRVTMDYLLFLPVGYDQKQSWPLLLFLHGAGERGDDLELVKKHGPPKIVEAKRDFSFIVVSPQCKANVWWEPIELLALLDHVVAKYKVDEDRISVTGLSMGGFGTWGLAFREPDRFAAIAPICGGGEPYWAERFRHLPVWAFHGAKDPVVPLRRTQEMVDALKKAGGRPKLTVYPEADHDSWTETYDNPEFYEWLLRQKRSTKDSK
jgi:predicted peptidase